MEETSQFTEIFAIYQQKIDQKKFGEIFRRTGNSGEYLAWKKIGNCLKIKNVQTYLKGIKQAIEAHIKEMAWEAIEKSLKLFTIQRSQSKNAKSSKKNEKKDVNNYLSKLEKLLIKYIGNQEKTKGKKKKSDQQSNRFNL